MRGWRSFLLGVLTVSCVVSRTTHAGHADLCPLLMNDFSIYGAEFFSRVKALAEKNILTVDEILKISKSPFPINPLQGRLLELGLVAHSKAFDRVLPKIGEKAWQDLTSRLNRLASSRAVAERVQHNNSEDTHEIIFPHLKERFAAETYNSDNYSFFSSQDLDVAYRVVLEGLEVFRGWQRENGTPLDALGLKPLSSRYWFFKVGTGEMRVAISEFDGNGHEVVRVYDVETGKQLNKDLPGGLNEFNEAEVFEHDERYYLVGRKYEAAYSIDLQTGQKIFWGAMNGFSVSVETKSQIFHSQKRLVSAAVVRGNLSGRVTNQVDRYLALVDVLTGKSVSHHPFDGYINQSTGQSYLDPKIVGVFPDSTGHSTVVWIQHPSPGTLNPEFDIYDLETGEQTGSVVLSESLVGDAPKLISHNGTQQVAIVTATQIVMADPRTGLVLAQVFHRVNGAKAAFYEGDSQNLILHLQDTNKHLTFDFVQRPSASQAGAE